MTPADALGIDGYKLNHTKRSAEETHGSYRIRKHMHAELTIVAAELGLVLLQKKLGEMASSFDSNARVSLFYESVRLPPYSGLICAKTKDKLPQLARDINTYIFAVSQLRGRATVVSAITTSPKPPALGSGSTDVTGLTGTEDKLPDGAGGGLSVKTMGDIAPVALGVEPQEENDEGVDLDLLSPIEWVEGAEPMLDITLKKDISSVAHVSYLRGSGGYTYLEPGVRAKDEPLKMLVAADGCWDYVVAHQHSLPVHQQRTLLRKSGEQYAALANHYESNSRLYRFFKKDGSAIPIEERRLTKALEKETSVSMKVFKKDKLLLPKDKCASDMEAMRAGVELAKVDKADGKKRKYIGPCRFYTTNGLAGLHDEDPAGPSQDHRTRQRL